MVRSLYKKSTIHLTFNKAGYTATPVADGWAGAVMLKPLGIQKCDGPTYRPTQQGVVACPRLKRQSDRKDMKRHKETKRDKKRHKEICRDIN